MRRYSFLIGALSAVATFVALSAFTGRRPWDREARGSYGWHRHHCQGDSRWYNDRGDDRIFRGRNDRDRTVPIDSARHEFNPSNDSGENR